MTILASDLRDLVIRPVLERMDAAVSGMKSEAAELLLLGTAAQESQMGRYLRQHPQGPARGLYQLEPATFFDLMKWLDGHPRLHAAVTEWASDVVPYGSQLAGNLLFSTAVARANYWRKPFTFTDGPVDRRELAHIYKKFWNSELGKATEADFLRNFERYVEQP